MRSSQCCTYAKSGKWRIMYGHPETEYPVNNGGGKRCVKIELYIYRGVKRGDE